MKKNVSAIISIVISVFLIVAVNTFLHPCKGEMAMPCTYNTRTAVMLLVLILIANAAKLFVGEYKSKLALNIATIAAAAEIAVIPQFNSCEGMMMTCNMKTVPALLIGSLLIIATNIVFSAVPVITARRA
jgi:hypothetical protein